MHKKNLKILWSKDAHLLLNKHLRWAWNLSINWVIKNSEFKTSPQLMQIRHVSHLIFSIGCWNVTCHLNILFILITGHGRTFLTFFCQLFFYYLFCVIWDSQIENDRFLNFKMGIYWNSIELFVWRVVSHCRCERWINISRAL